MHEKSIDVLCLGELLIDFVAQQASRSLEEVESFLQAAGGAPANVAVALSRLSGRAGFLGRVGDDPFGRFLTETLRKNAVQTEAMQVDPRSPTPLAFVSIDHQRKRDFCFIRHDAADEHIAFDDTAAATLAGARMLHFGSFTLSAPDSREATLQAVAFAREKGIRVSFDPNIRTTIWPSLDDCVRSVMEALPSADLLKVSQEEAALLTGGENDVNAQADALLERGPSLVVVTLGKFGCHVATRKEHVNVRGFVVPPVDTTGAGDGFWGGMLYALAVVPGVLENPGAVDGRFLADAGSLANAVGAVTTQTRGAIPSLPSRQSLVAFLSSYVTDFPFETFFPKSPARSMAPTQPTRHDH